LYLKGKAVPLQAWSGPEGSRKLTLNLLTTTIVAPPSNPSKWQMGFNLAFKGLRLSDFMTTAQEGGKVVSLKHRPPLSPGNTPGTHFC